MALRDWEMLRDSLVSLDARVQRGELIAGDSWSLPGDLTGPAARDYLERARVRLEEVARAVDRAASSPLERLRDAGRDVAMRARLAAEHAARIAREIASDMSEAFQATAEKMAKSGESLATGLGIGAVLVVVVALLLLREWKS